MVLMRLISNDAERVRYSYQPESDGEPGILSYCKKTNTPTIEKLAERDGKSVFYRNHAFAMIRDTLADPPEERLLAWY